MASRLRLCLVLIVTMSALAGCGSFTGKRDAEAVAANVFEALRSRDYDRALAFYSPRFFEKTPRTVWLKTLSAVAERFGNLESYELVQSHAQRYFSASGSGTYYQLGNKVLYSKTAASEVLVLFRPLLGGDIQVVRHHIDSAAPLTG